MSLIFREENLRARSFQFIATDTTGDTLTDIYVAPDGVEIRVNLDPDGAPDGAFFCHPDASGAHPVFGEDGHPLTEEEVEVLAFELLDDDPHLIGRLTGEQMEEAVADDVSFG